MHVVALEAELYIGLYTELELHHFTLLELGITLLLLFIFVSIINFTQ